MFNNDPYYVPFFSVKVNNNSLSQNAADSIKSISINYQLEGADTFALKVNNRDLQWIEAEQNLFAEGNEIHIVYGYTGGKTGDLAGEISSLEVDFSSDGTSTLSITGFDLSKRLMRGQVTKTYTDIKDSAIAQKIASDSGFTPEVEGTSEIHNSITQNNMSDFDFLKERADNLKYEFRIFKNSSSGANTLYFKKAQDSKKEVVKLEWLASLISFSPKINLADQVEKVVVRGYDAVERKAIVGTAVQPGWVESIIAMKAGDVISRGSGGESTHTLENQDVKSKAEADNLAASIMQRITDKLLTGSGSCVGMPDLRAGTVLELTGLGSRFSGKYYITSSTHSLSDSGYTTNFEIIKRG